MEGKNLIGSDLMLGRRSGLFNRATSRRGIGFALVALVLGSVLLWSTPTQAQTTCSTTDAAVSGFSGTLTDLVTDCTTLLGLMDTLRGTQSLNWAETLSMSSWDGVTVAGTSPRVTELTLNRTVNGSIPAALGDLGGLTRLDLGKNSLSGSIPAELNQLTNLTYLALDNAGLSGTIPDLSTLTSLEKLYLHANNFTGTFPTWLGTLTNLTHLHLFGTAKKDPLGVGLSGTIPDLSTLTSLEELIIDDNGLTGMIPTWLGDLTSLTRLDLDRNPLGGTIPAVLGNLSNLNHLDLSENGLTGTIPAELGNLSNLEHLSLYDHHAINKPLQDNALEGDIPATWGTATHPLPNLRELSLAGNALEGEIPEALGGLSSLTRLLLFNNALEGDIPATWGTATHPLPNLRELSLAGNALEGEIPEALGGLSSLEILQLHRNQLSGAIPAALGQLTNLTTLWLHGNKLESPLPDLSTLTAMEDLDLSYNPLLTDTFPAWLADLSNLQYLYLRFTGLNGPIPAGLGTLSSLFHLHLAATDWTGTIPQALRDKQTAGTLSLWTNRRPVPPAVEEQILPVGQPFEYLVAFSDPEGETLTYHATQAGATPTDPDLPLPAWLAIDTTSGTLSGTLPEEFGGQSLMVRVIANDRDVPPNPPTDEMPFCGSPSETETNPPALCGAVFVTLTAALPPVTFSQASLTIDEGTSDAYTVVLDTEPTTAVTISISAGGDVTTQPTSLLFTPTNWGTPQTVTVSAGNDDDASDDTVTITHTVTSDSAAEYAVFTILPDVHVTVLDDEVYHQVTTLRTLVANTGSGNNQAQIINTFAIDRWAQGFTTGIAGGGYVLGSVGLRLSTTDSNASPGDLEVTINQVAANGHPGDALCTLNNPASLQQHTVNAFTPPTAGDGRCPALKPNTKYFVVIKRISGTPAIRLTKTSRNGEDSGHAARGWSIGDSSQYAHAGATVWLSDVNALKLDIEGDYVPALTAIDASAEESGDPNSSTTMTFQIYLDQKVQHSVSVDYATQDATAEAGVNYQHTSGTVTFAPREQVKIVDVDILEDDKGGSTYFKLILSNPRRAGLRANSPGTGRIFDASPRFRSWDTSARESNTGRDSTMSFVVEFDHRPHGDTADYTVDYRTEAVTATAGSDYESTSGTLTFAPTDGDKQVTVTIKDDEIQDNGETFRLVLSKPSNGAQLHRTAGTVIGTILNHDSEGLTATFPASAYASKSHKGPTDRPQVVVAFNSAVASISTTTPSAVVNGASITSVQAHTEDGLQNAQIFFLEPDGNDDITFTLVANVPCASGGICSGTGTPITQVPSAHTIPAKQTTTASQLSVADATASEEDDSTIDFVVTLNPASDESVTVDYATANGSAAAGGDYTAASGSLTFNAGETTKTIQVSIIDDTVDDDNETLTITLSNASGAEISDGLATGTITDGDTESVPLTAAFQDMPDSHDGSTAFTFRVLFSEDVGISYANMRDDAFSLSEGDVTGARRVDGRNDLWEITVEPDDNSDVGITLPANRSCTTTGAICTREDSPRQLTNSPTATVTGPAEAPPTNTSATGAPTISGTPQVDQTLTADTSSITDEDGLTNVSYRYQWSAGGSDIDGATGSTYTLTASEQGQTIQVRVTFTDDADNEEILTSVATVAVAAEPNRSATGKPTIGGTPQVDQTLTADTSPIDDADGLTNATFEYQWIAGGSDIDGATGSSYTLTYSEQGQTIQVRVTFTDDADNEETLTSVATVAVAAAPNRSATGRPTIGGTPQVDQTLTADTSPIDDADGLTNVSYRYQWTAGGTDIEGATGASFTLTASQQGKAIQVQVTFTDDRGNAESLTSEPTDAVAAKPTPLTVRLKAAAPATHDGSSEFTFEIEFSEEFGISYATMRDHAFTVTGGSVEKAQRTDKPSNIPWRIEIKPQGNGDVTIVLPATTDCNADGAICTGDGRKLSNSLSFTVSGPGQ